MTAQLRKSGIGAVGDVPWGTHFCHYYETKEELLEILVPYFIAGLQNNEWCVWVVCDPVSEAEAHQAIASQFPGLAGDVPGIQIVSYADWYLKDGVFDRRRVNRAWNDRLEEALAKGYGGMRVSGIEAWLTDESWHEFSEYEMELNDLVANRQIVVLCTHPLGRASDFFKIARTHEFVVAKHLGNWKMLETPERRQASREVQLERRVTERTNELEDANCQLRALSASLQFAKEEEGSRISRRIHDELGSALTSLKWDLERLHQTISGGADPAALSGVCEKLREMTKLTAITIGTVRGIASDLRPIILDDLGLVEAVEWQLQQFQAQTAIPCYCNRRLDSAELSPHQATAIFRIFQEALTNVLRHAQATRVDVAMKEGEGHFVLEIRDNGRGLREDERPARLSLGLLGMRERARNILAKLEIVSPEGQGTIVTVRVPTGVTDLGVDE